jgi:seryl-tRNA synthetase
MADINAFRTDKGGNPEAMRELFRQRNKDPAGVDRIIEIDNRWRADQHAVEQQRKEINDIQK